MPTYPTDLQLDNFSTEDTQIKPASSSTTQTINYYEEENKQPITDHHTPPKEWLQNFKDSFKPIKLNEIDPNLSDVEKANLRSSKAPFQRRLKNRHIQMIAIGSAIGTGLFVGSGSALATGGPASLIICYALVGAMIFCTIQALGELAVSFPVSGSYVAFNTRFISPIWGFSVGLVVCMQWLILLPIELVACGMTIKYWDSNTNSCAYVTIFYVLIAIINIFGVRGYGEAEFTFSSIKVIAIFGFIIVGIVINCGGAPNGGYIGGEYWHNPGAFHDGFKGFCSVFVTGAFSFGGTELVGLTAAEAEHPHKSLPRAAKQVAWRITLFYLVSLVIVGVLVPYDNPNLLGSSSVDIKASAFVIAINRAGIKVLPDIMNAVILVSLISVANSAVYGCSRTLSSLGNQGFIPKIFAYIDRQGRPLVGIITSLAVGLLCYLVGSDKEDEIFTWLMALSGLSTIFVWGSICTSHLRYRRALKVQGRTTDELSFKAIFGIYGSIFGVFLNLLILCVQFWVALFPIGSKPTAKAFFAKYLSFVVIIFFYVVYALFKYKNYILFIRAKDIDIDTGKRVPDLELLKQEIQEERQTLAAKSWWYRTYKFWC